MTDAIRTESGGSFVCAVCGKAINPRAPHYCRDELLLARIEGIERRLALLEEQHGIFAASVSSPETR